jgi:hypothetical protein
MSLEYLHVPLSIDVEGAEFELAFTAYGDETDPSEWHAATYADGSVRVLVGPGGAVELAVGDYMVWVRVTANPEIPVRQAGRIVIFGEEGS